MIIRTDIVGQRKLILALRELQPQFAALVYGPATAAAARVVRDAAKKKNFGFTDGRGVRSFDAGQGRTKSVRLRSTIRARRIPARYGTRRYRTGRAAVTVGAEGARHGFLVEAGHGGPRPAAAHPFLTRALLDTQNRQFAEFIAKARERYPIAAAAAARKGI